MNQKLIVLAFALSTAAWGAQITLQPGPNGTYVDLMIGGLGNVQVGAYDLLIDSPFMIGVSAYSLGSLGTPEVETFWQSQEMVIGPAMRRLQLIEISLLASADLMALQSATSGTFGLVRLSLPPLWPEIVFFSISGTISDAAGDPIYTTFTSGELRKIPEPATLSLVLVALILILLRMALLNSGLRAVAPAKQRRIEFHPTASATENAASSAH